MIIFVECLGIAVSVNIFLVAWFLSINSLLFTIAGCNDENGDYNKQYQQHNKDEDTDIRFSSRACKAFFRGKYTFLAALGITLFLGFNATFFGTHILTLLDLTLNATLGFADFLVLLGEAHVFVLAYSIAWYIALAAILVSNFAGADIHRHDQLFSTKCLYGACLSARVIAFILLVCHYRTLADEFILVYSALTVTFRFASQFTFVHFWTHDLDVDVIYDLHSNYPSEWVIYICNSHLVYSFFKIT